MRRLSWLTLGVLFLGSTATLPQGAQSNSYQDSGGGNWRDVPVAFSDHADAVSIAVRKARDDYWVRFFPAPQNGMVSAFPVGAIVPKDSPEIYPEPGAFWAIATFVNYDVHEVSTGGIYTETHFRIDRIVASLANATPQVGEFIDVDLAGGTGKTASGEIHHRTGSKQEWVEAPSPGGRYLIQLYPISSANFYLAQDYWDLSKGVARPIKDRDQMLARTGKSHVTGLSEEDAVVYIQKLISPK